METSALHGTLGYGYRVLTWGMVASYHERTPATPGLKRLGRAGVLSFQDRTAAWARSAIELPEPVKAIMWASSRDRSPRTGRTHCSHSATAFTAA